MKKTAGEDNTDRQPTTEKAVQGEHCVNIRRFNVDRERSPAPGGVGERTSAAGKLVLDNVNVSLGACAGVSVEGCACVRVGGGTR